MNKAERIKRMRVPAVDPALARRLPPGQVLTERFPILHEGEVPVYDLETWTLRVFGEVDREVTLSYADIMAMPQTTITCDIHCVTRWSRFDNRFTGVRFRDFLAAAGVTPRGRYVMLHGDYGYTANAALADLERDDVLLAHSFDGAPLTDKHGWPLRLIVPHLYFWKSVKWLRGIEFLNENNPGFWEQNGFHLNGDPFREERFSGEALPIPEDEWEKKEFD
ncbi:MULTISPECIES: sulfite oxidase-like oxidoreductase [Brevibacillus]|jgi:DMSO/TMAO reductase YedYZ molybdopterin-dependent catalytic subunit|uniref:Oxidoreductase n=1 Tax=Brevibacillus aydinogluensis TaxID=927786 RepID=A0AA48M6H5_9BACL|nr:MULTISPECIES: sulfite oxidase-like oxidoreductase [Bacillales]MDT3416286.1 DMSO/TMAO reductase YedYZ molybdopterin-dependent catalytic subunit [Brevibacillus aydinogluensis]REK66310.1 MAG: sulfite oxidase-like oxidoreductase [Brevibacillus sp.]UFJ62115.1 sulfite oxidase-like oxidoreductase [Anoxybacillus sediminis]CAJ1000831.1 Oxidoreductase [Brevibacillus aydinogluensis]